MDSRLLLGSAIPFAMAYVPNFGNADMLEFRHALRQPSIGTRSKATKDRTEIKKRRKQRLRTRTKRK